MFNGILASITSSAAAFRRKVGSRRGGIEELRIEISALNVKIGDLQKAAESLQQSQANQELRAAGWHADMINQQRKLEETLVRFASLNRGDRSDGTVLSAPVAPNTKKEPAASFDDKAQ